MHGWPVPLWVLWYIAEEKTLPQPMRELGSGYLGKQTWKGMGTEWLQSDKERSKLGSA